MFKNNNNKKNFFCLVAFVMSAVLFFNSTSYASYAIPVMPSVTPSLGYSLDLLSNLFGFEGIGSRASSLEEVVQGWENAARSAFDTSFDVAWTKIKNALKGIENNRKLVIDNETRIYFNELLDEAHTNGIPLHGQVTAITDPEYLKQAIALNIPLQGYSRTIYMDAVNTVMNAAIEHWGSGNFTAVLMGQTVTPSVPNDSSNIYNVIFYPVSWSPLTLIQDGNEYTWQSNGVSYISAYWVSRANYSYGQNSRFLSYEHTAGEFVNINYGAYEAGGARVYIEAAYESFYTAMRESALTLLTEYSALTEDGAYDDTAEENKVITIPFPLNIPFQIADTVSDIISVATAVGVLPIDQTSEEDLTDAKEELSFAVPSFASDYRIGLTMFFPFCIPKDLETIFKLFEAPPVAPSFTFVFPISYDVNTENSPGDFEEWKSDDLDVTYIKSHFVYKKFTFDLSDFDGVAAIVRKGEIVLFACGLALATRRIFLRG